MIRVTHARYFITVPGLEQHCSKVQFQGGINPVPGGINPVPGRSGTTFQVAIRGICSSQRRPTLVNPTTLGVGTRVRQRQSPVTPAIHDEQSTLVVIARTTVVQRD